jgi:hypothetical protein
MQKAIIILFFLLTPLFLSAQDRDRNRGVFINVTPSLIVHSSINSTQFDESGSLVSRGAIPNPNSGTVSYFVEAGYFVVPKRLSVGLGFGWASNGAIDRAYLPLYLDCKFFLLQSRNSPLIYAGLGRLIPANSDNIKGNILSAGIGVKRFFTNKLAASFSVGYSLTEVIFVQDKAYLANDYNHRYEINLSGVEIKFGLYF